MKKKRKRKQPCRRIGIVRKGGLDMCQPAPLSLSLSLPQTLIYLKTFKKSGRKNHGILLPFVK
jgi:hypothetical protein